MEPDSVDTKKLIKEQFLRLPQPIKDAIIQSNWEDKVRNIVTKYNLHLDQGTVIENQTLMAILGFVEPEEFTSLLEENGNIPHPVAINVTKDIENDVFQYIRDMLVESNTPSTDVIEEKEPISPDTVISDLSSEEVPKSVSMPDVPNVDDMPDGAGEVHPERDDILNEIENPVDTYREPIPEVTENIGDLTVEPAPDLQDEQAPQEEVANDIPIRVSEEPVIEETPIPESEPVFTPDPAPIPETVEPQEELVAEAPIPEMVPPQQVDEIPDPLPMVDEPTVANHPAPQDLPVGDIANVPEHGHDHSDIISQKLGSTIISGKEEITHDEVTKMENPNDAPNLAEASKTIDPYREPVE